MYYKLESFAITMVIISTVVLVLNVLYTKKVFSVSIAATKQNIVDILISIINLIIRNASINSVENSTLLPQRARLH